MQVAGRHLIVSTVKGRFGVVGGTIMLDLRLHWHGASILFGLFAAGFVWPAEHVALAAH